MQRISRRSAVKLFSLGAAGIATGCCYQSPSKSSIVSHFDISNYSALFLFTLKSDDQRQKTIDAHGHFFNASDIQAGGYFSGPVFNDYADKKASSNRFLPLVKAIGNFLQKVGNTLAPSAEYELKKYGEIKRYFEERSLGNSLDIKKQISQSNEMLKKYLDSSDKNISRRVAEALSKEKEFVKAFNDYCENSSFIKDFRTREIRSVDNTNTLELILYKSLKNEIDVFGVDAKSDKTLIESAQKLSSFLRFVLRFFSYRFDNVCAHYQAYNRNTSKVKIVNVTDVMVDFDFWLDGCSMPVSTLEDQIKVHTAIHKLTNGYTIPIAPFNPWTASIDGGHYFDILDKAFASGIFKGAKIYPTIGYYPSGATEKSPLFSFQRWMKPSDADFIKTMDRFFELCNKYEVTVMAHGLHSKGAEVTHKLDTRDMAGPAGWEIVMKKWPNLKVNIGHAGGFYSQVNEKNNNWTTQFASLMRDYKGFYADIGYWNEIFTDNHGETLERLVELIEHEPAVATNLMFGTDWFMLDQEPYWKQYPDRIFELLSQHRVRDKDIENIFYRNADRLFSLSG